MIDFMAVVVGQEWRCTVGPGGVTVRCSTSSKSGWLIVEFGLRYLICDESEPMRQGAFDELPRPRSLLTSTTVPAAY